MSSPRPDKSRVCDELCVPVVFGVFAASLTQNAAALAECVQRVRYTSSTQGVVIGLNSLTIWNLGKHANIAYTPPPSLAKKWA